MFCGLTVKDGDFGLGADVLELGAWLNGDGFAETRADDARFLDNGDDGGGFSHAKDLAILSGIADNIAGAEGVGVGHK